MNPHAEMKSPRRRLILLSIAALLVGALYLALSLLGDSAAAPPGSAAYRDLAEHPDKHMGETISTEGELLALLWLKGPALFEAELYDPKTGEKYLCQFSQDPLHFRPRQRAAFTGTFEGIGKKTSRDGMQIRAPLLVGKRLLPVEPPAPATTIERADPPLALTPARITEALFRAAKAAKMKEEPTEEAETTYYDFVLFPTPHRGERFRMRGTVAEIKETELGAITVHKVTIVSDKAAPAIAYTDRLADLPDGLARGDVVEMEGVFVDSESFVNERGMTLLAPAFVETAVTPQPVDSGAVETLAAGLWLALAVTLAIIYLFLRRRLKRG